MFYICLTGHIVKHPLGCFQIEHTPLGVFCQGSCEYSRQNGEYLARNAMQRYDMTPLSLATSLEASFFLTREQGKLVYQELTAHLQTLPEGRALTLTFPPNQLVDASFADASLIQLGKEMMADQFGARGLLLEGLSVDSIYNINAVIQARRLKLAFLIVEPSGTVRYCGQLEPSLRETLELVIRSGKLSTPELADMLHLAANSASNRLKRLYHRHLIRREVEVSEKGLRYSYSSWQNVV